MSTFYARTKTQKRILYYFTLERRLGSRHRRILETPASKGRYLGPKGLFIIDIEVALSVDEVSSIRTVGGL